MPTPSNNPERRTPQPGELSRDPRADASPVLSRRIVSQAHYFDSTLKMMPGITIPLRSMLVDASEQQILVSPVATVEEESHIGGAPLVLVAPSLLHHLHIRTAIERYQPIVLWGPPGLAEKQPELGPMRTLGVDPWPYAGQLEYVVVQGAPRRNEVVFFHRASRTIYTADLFFNICHPQNVLASIALRLMGIHKRFGAAKMWRKWVVDRAAFSRSIDEILAWEFDRIVVAHGEIVDENARDRFEIALRELQLLD